MRRRVTVAAATYLRPHDLERCVPALLAEMDRSRAVRPELEIELLIVDNDAAGSGRPVLEKHADPRLRYVVEPTPGISAARNRALAETGRSDVLVFVDDDEEPVPGWLLALYGAYEAFDAAAVAGRVTSVFEAPLDPWIEAGQFFRRRSLPTGTAIRVAATNNLLLDLAVVRRLGIRFEPRYGLSGGGDQHFTRALVATGASMVWCEEAVMVDHVPADRQTRRWVLARQRRTGNTEVVVDVDLAAGYRGRMASRGRGAARGALRLSWGALMLGAGVVGRSTPHQARGAKAVARGRGMVAGAFGRQVREYERPSPTRKARIR